MPKSNDRGKFYGAITVSDRGQIVIPAEARRDFNIDVGDKLLVLGQLEKGLWIAKASTLLGMVPDFAAVLDEEGISPKDEEP